MLRHAGDSAKGAGGARDRIQAQLRDAAHYGKDAVRAVLGRNEVQLVDEATLVRCSPLFPCPLRTHLQHDAMTRPGWCSRRDAPPAAQRMPCDACRGVFILIPCTVLWTDLGFLAQKATPKPRMRACCPPWRCLPSTPQPFSLHPATFASIPGRYTLRRRSRSRLYLRLTVDNKHAWRRSSRRAPIATRRETCATPTLQLLSMPRHLQGPGREQ